MLVHVLRKGVRTVENGPVPIGKVVEMNDAVAREYLRVGAVQKYETKVIKEHPLSDAGEVTQSSALPAAQALPPTTSKQSRRGRKPKNAQ